MPARCVIGVDLGGTKLLAGAVDPDRLTVHHRTRREVFGIDQTALLDAAVDAVQEASDAVDGDVKAVGFGIPCTFDRRTGVAVQAVNLPLADLKFGEVMSERLGLPVEVDNDANCAVWAEAQAGAAKGSTDVALLTIGTGIGGGLVLGGRLYRGWAGAGAEMGHMVVDIDGPPCQGNCPNWGCLESVASGTALVREAALRVAREPDTPLGIALEEGRALTGPLITELAYEGDAVAAAAVRVVGERLGRRDREPREHLQPRGRGHRGRRDRGGRAAARARAPGDDEARAGAGEGHGPRGRDPVRRGLGDDRRGAAGGGPGGGGVGPAAAVMTGGRLVVCPTPIGNLEDVTLRVLAALREADLVACEDTRRTRVLLERYGVQATLVSYHEHNERERTPELVGKMVDGTVVALVSDAGMPLVSDPGYVLVAGCIAAGLEVEVLPGPSAAISALVASGLPADRWRFAGFLPRKRGPLEALLGAEETLVAFESPRRVGASLKVLAALDPARPVAVCRELTKLHEEIVRGEAAELAARYADTPPRGEVVLVIGAAPPRTGADPAAIDAVRRLVEAGARARPAASVVAELTGGAANDLYRAVTEGAQDRTD